MRRRGRHLPNLLLRLLLAAGCVLPFADARALVLIPAAAATPAGPAGQVDDEREKETDKEKEEQDGQEQTANPRADRRPDRHDPSIRLRTFHAARDSFPAHRLRRPTAADPFRNGLGTPYRC